MVNEQRMVGAHERRYLADRILDVIGSGPDGPAEVFDALALEVFAYQYAHSEPYRSYCDAAGVTPSTVHDWSDIPAYPTQAFKDEVVTSFPMSEATFAALTSGTTSANQRGRIFRDEIGRELAFTANRVMTGAYIFPDFEQGRRCRILFLAPSPQMAPTMGMAIGMEQTRVHFGSPASAFLLGRSGIDVNALIAHLREAERIGEPVALIGATSAFVYFLNACRRKRMRFCLPPGSRVVDGGGYRGRFGEVTRDDYYDLVNECLGVPTSYCVNTLGMAESSTNYSDRTLRDTVLGHEPRERRKAVPPWTRVFARDPMTGERLPHGQPGLLVHYDLANLPTVIGVMTDNLGFTDPDGSFEIIGRARVIDGRISELPSERPVGPMGDRRVFRLLEAYVNFSIDFKMGRFSSKDATGPASEAVRRESSATGVPAKSVVPSCPLVVDDLVAAADDPEAARAAAAALATFEAQARDEVGEVANREETVPDSADSETR